MGSKSIKLAISLAALTLCSGAHAGPHYQSGYISGITYIGDSVLVMLNTGAPDNCAGSPSGWMRIDVAYKAMQGYVTGLWLRGDAAQTPVYIYTNPPPSAGAYCTVTQINPQA